MLFIVSPAKKMNVVDDFLPSCGTPGFLDKTKQLAEAIYALDFHEAQALWQCSESLAQLNFERFRGMKEGVDATTPAVLAYEGIQYQHLAAHVMQSDQLDYLQQHLRILSGFYGALRPFDAVVPYRLEMQAKLACLGHQNLYDFWGSSLFDFLAAETDLIINLASVEYAKAVLPYADKCSESGVAPRTITCLFGTVNEGGRLVQRSTAAKAARGSMVRWCAENKVSNPDELKEFNVAGYGFEPALSSSDCFVFASVIPHTESRS